jgi:hypothetical protein
VYGDVEWRDKMEITHLPKSGVGAMPIRSSNNVQITKDEITLTYVCMCMYLCMYIHGVGMYVFVWCGARVCNST